MIQLKIEPMMMMIIVDCTCLHINDNLNKLCNYKIKSTLFVLKKTQSKRYRFKMKTEKNTGIFTVLKMVACWSLIKNFDG